MNPIPPSSMPRSRKAQLFWPLVVALLVADCATKELAVEHLSPPSVPHAVLDDWLRLTLAYNRAIASRLPVRQAEPVRWPCSSPVRRATSWIGSVRRRASLTSLM